MLTPISNAYAPLFRHRCIFCDRWTDSTQLMADEEPFRFVCSGHWTADEHVAASRAYDAQFRALSPEDKYRARVQLFGKSRADEITKGARP